MANKSYGVFNVPAAAAAVKTAWTAVSRDDDDDYRTAEEMHQSHEERRRQFAKREAEKAAYAARRAEAERFYQEFDAAAGLVDAEALDAAEGRLAAAVGYAAHVAEELDRQRATLTRLEAKSASDLEGASLDELARIAKGRSAASDELRAVAAVVAELERRLQDARAAIATAERHVGELRTAGLQRLAVDLAGDAAGDAMQLAEKLHRLQRLSQLIISRGGATPQLLPNRNRVARDLEAMVKRHAGIPA